MSDRHRAALPQKKGSVELLVTEPKKVQISELNSQLLVKFSFAL